jgi:hypothetical protein
MKVIYSQLLQDVIGTVDSAFAFMKHNVVRTAIPPFETGTSESDFRKPALYLVEVSVGRMSRKKNPTELE